MSIRQLASYLLVSEKTVYRMTEGRKLPGIRVGSQWRFRRADIDTWLEEQVRRVEREGGPAAVEATASDMRIAPLLQEENVLIPARRLSRDALVEHMVRRAALDPHVDRAALAESILRRECVCSTALLPDVAFPHPESPEAFRFSRKRLLVAVLPEAADFSDPHGHRPQVVVIILARSLQGHLLALSRALKLFGGGDLTARLRRCRSGAEVVEAIGREEALLATREAPPGARRRRRTS